MAAVKLEGGAEMAPQIQRLTAGGIPVCAHIGFTPQYEHVLGGYRVQGRGEAAERLLADAQHDEIRQRGHDHGRARPRPGSRCGCGCCACTSWA